ncbi:tigger transposable element-derived protein 6-like [Aphis gossypii]|uniref:tigger transposable element-derived protein 6-like n=1 Tax=Aphis gossypii TaxID=80765 RepID=UPI0021595725|nr:tigger transposable element-derived protein 6-like [Aphis gossypii]
MQTLTILLVCNMTGTDKRRPLIIGKSKNPRCFRAVKTLPVDYYANSNAWMTSQIFTEFLRKWDKEIKKPRRILLILDNCTAHPNLQNLENIDLKFLPPNTTSLIQPLDQGIIKTMKTYYRKAMRNFIVETIDVCLIPASQIARKITVLEAIHMVVNAWDMVTYKCIINCFRKAGFSQIESDEEESQEVEFIDTNFENWILIDQDLPTFGALSDKDITDLQTKKEEINIDDDEDDDNEETNEDITQKDTRIILEKLKGAVQKYGDNDTFQLFQKRQANMKTKLVDCQVQSKIDSFFKLF